VVEAKPFQCCTYLARIESSRGTTAQLQPLANERKFKDQTDLERKTAMKAAMGVAETMMFGVAALRHPT
jgi:hypothetical protein